MNDSRICFILTLPPVAGRHNCDSMIFRFCVDQEHYLPFQAVKTRGARHMHSFTLGSRPLHHTFLAIANFCEDTQTGVNHEGVADWAVGMIMNLNLLFVITSSYSSFHICLSRHSTFRCSPPSGRYMHPPHRLRNLPVSPRQVRALPGDQDRLRSTVDGSPGKLNEKIIN